MTNSPNKGKGKGIAFLRAHMADDDGPCLIWPMFRDQVNGDGVVGHNGRMYKAHRLMCILAHGEPPSPTHQSAHSCGNRSDGCVHPKHVSWKTPSENMLDTVIHGTAKKAGAPRAKLTPAAAAEIRALAGTMSHVELGKRFGVHRTCVGKVLRGELWPTLS